MWGRDTRLSTIYFLRIWEDRAILYLKAFCSMERTNIMESQAVVNVILITPPGSQNVDSLVDIIIWWKFSILLLKLSREKALWKWKWEIKWITSVSQIVFNAQDLHWTEDKLLLRKWPLFLIYTGVCKTYVKEGPLFKGKISYRYMV